MSCLFSSQHELSAVGRHMKVLQPHLLHWRCCVFTTPSTAVYFLLFIRELFKTRTQPYVSYIPSPCCSSFSPTYRLPLDKYTKCYFCTFLLYVILSRSKEHKTYVHTLWLGREYIHTHPEKEPSTHAETQIYTYKRIERLVYFVTYVVFDSI